MTIIFGETQSNSILGGLNISALIKLYFICPLILTCLCVLALGMEMHMFDSCIHGCHVSKECGCH